jgi:hypothetical protein
MKLLFLFFGLLAFVSGPVNYVQVVYTAPLSKDIIKQDDLYIYKGDSLNIIYSFWADGGVMAFMILNKSHTPVYIDWTKSAYADQKITQSYYPVNRTGNGISEANDIYKTPADWYKLFAPYMLSGYEGTENGLMEEPVTLLPAKSYLFRTCYRILPTTKFSVKKLKPAEIPLISGMRESFPGWIMEGDTANAALAFSNSITYAADKDFSNAKHINNQFYVWQVLTFEDAYFDNYDKDNNSVNCPYHSDKRYFISHLRISDFD